MTAKTLLLYIVVVAASAGLAYGVFLQVRDDEAERQTAGPAVDDIPDPLWYRTAPREVRVAGLRSRLGSMTSTLLSATEIGPNKDDIALLCRDQEMIDLLVESFRARKDFGPAELSAFMEIFARVKSEKLGPLVEAGINHPRFEPQINAVEAAILQADPSLVPFLAAALPKHEGYVAAKIIEALVAIGTGEALGVVVRAIDSNDRVTVVHAIRAAVSQNVRDAITRMERKLEHEDPSIRVSAAWGLASMGQSRGRRILEEHLRDTRLPTEARAQGVQFLLAVAGPDALEVLRGLVDDPDDKVAFEARVSLAAYRDPAMLEALRRDLESDDDILTLEALRVLGTTGQDDDIELVRGRLDDLTPVEVETFVQSVGRRRVTPLAVRFLVEASRISPAIERIAIPRLSAMGDAGVDALEKLLGEDPGRDRLGHIIASLGATASPRAIEILEGVDPGDDRELWLGLRNNIRAIDLRLLKE